MTDSTLQIYLARNNQQAGPYSLEQVNQMLASQQVLLTDLAWHQGLSEWKVLGELTQGQLVYQPQGYSTTTTTANTSIFDTPRQHNNTATSTQTNNKEVKIAGLGKRITAKLVDLAIFLVPQLAVSWYYFPFDAIPDFSQPISAEKQIKIAQLLTERIPNVLEYGLLIYSLLIVLVQMQLVTTSGQSIGKKIFKLRIVDVESNQIVGAMRGFMLRSVLFIVISQFLGLFPFLIFVLIADFLLLFSKQHRTLHDRICNTKVIDLKQ